jgi:hypothetical protein
MKRRSVAMTVLCLVATVGLTQPSQAADQQLQSRAWCDSETWPAVTPIAPTCAASAGATGSHVRLQASVSSPREGTLPATRGDGARAYAEIAQTIPVDSSIVDVRFDVDTATLRRDAYPQDRPLALATMYVFWQAEYEDGSTVIHCCDSLSIEPGLRTVVVRFRLQTDPSIRSLTIGGGVLLDSRLIAPFAYSHQAPGSITVERTPLVCQSVVIGHACTPSFTVGIDEPLPVDQPPAVMAGVAVGKADAYVEADLSLNVSAS